MKTVTFFIDKQKIQCPPDTKIFDAAEQNGIYIPSLCRHPDLKPYGACRLCIVEDIKSGKLLASCVTPVSDRQEILTASERVISHRRNIIRLMMAEHSESCLVCSKGNRCLLRKIAAELEVAQQDLYPIPLKAAPVLSDPFIQRDHGKCILCGKCIRVCKDLIGCGVLGYSNRGVSSRPSTALGRSMDESGCTYCGACVAACPTGALSKMSETATGTPQRYHESVCGFCGVGCRLTYGITGGRIADVTPSRARSTVNGLSLCIKGQFAHDYLHSDERITAPMIRMENGLVPVPWKDALDAAAERLKSVIKQHGPHSVGFYGSSKCTNEENYLFQKLARAGVGTPNIDNGGAFYGRDLIKDLDQATSGLTRVNRFSDLEKADVIIVLGLSPGRSVPVLNYHIRRAVSNGSDLIIIGPENKDFHRYSAIRACPSGSLSPCDAYALLLCGIGSDLCRRQKEDLQYIDLFTRNYEELLGWLVSFELGAVSEKTGVSIETLKKISVCIQKKIISFVIGGDVLTLERGRDVTRSALNLSLLTGSIGGFGGNIYPVAQENNLTGSWDMGTLPDMLPGRAHISSGDMRQFFNRAWKAEIPETGGLDFKEMIQSAASGDLKALYIMGENPLRTHPRAQTAEALSRLELLIVQDILLTETAGSSHILLPGAASAEKSGSFTSMEGRIQRFTQAVHPPGNAKEDFVILRELSDRLGMKSVTFSEIQEEIALLPLYSGLSDHSSTWLRRPVFIDGNQDDTDNQKISFTKINPAAGITTDARFPLTAIVDTQLNHCGSGTRTSRSRNMKNAYWNGDVVISEKSGRDIGLTTGDHVRIFSEAGSITRRIRLQAGEENQCLLIPRAFNDNDVMTLFQTGTATAVQVGLEKVLTVNATIQGGDAT